MVKVKRGVFFARETQYLMTKPLYRLLLSMLFWVSVVAKGEISHDEVLSAGLVDGGEFRDLILPMPIYNGLETDLWGGDNVLPRDKDNGIESPDWSYWGGNPLRGDDGKYHMFVCRWSSSKGHKSWRASQVVHAVAERPTGPYRALGLAYPEHRNSLGHNPEVIRLNDGRYMLMLHSGHIYTTKTADVNSAWHYEGVIQIDANEWRGLAMDRNMTGFVRSDGSIVILTKMGQVMISETGNPTGPYEVVTPPPGVFTDYQGGPEDPVVWKSQHQYHMLYNLWKFRRAVHMRSHDGLHWKAEPGIAYRSDLAVYEDGTTVDWYKAERPKVMQDEYGRAIYFSMAVIDVMKEKDKGSDKHSSKNIVMPLVVERRVAIVNTAPISANTEEVKVRIKAEDGFNPHEDIDLETLRFGAAETVNYGRGVAIKNAKPDGKDLMVTFRGLHHGVSSNNFSAKMLGKTKRGGIFLAYARLPGLDDDPAALVIKPLSISVGKRAWSPNTLNISVKNYGLHRSTKTAVRIIDINKPERKVADDIPIPVLNAYQNHTAKVLITRAYSDDVRNYKLEFVD